MLVYRLLLLLHILLTLILVRMRILKLIRLLRCLGGAFRHHKSHIVCVDNKVMRVLMENYETFARAQQHKFVRCFCARSALSKYHRLSSAHQARAVRVVLRNLRLSRYVKQRVIVRIWGMPVGSCKFCIGRSLKEPRLLKGKLHICLHRLG